MVVVAASAGAAGAALSLGDGRATSLVPTGADVSSPAAVLTATSERTSRTLEVRRVGETSEPSIAMAPVSGDVPGARARALTAWLAAVWALGVVIALIPTVAALTGLAILARRARTVRGGRWALLIPSALRELDVRRRVRFLELDGPIMPMTWGVFHPVVLLPADDFDSTIEQRLDVLRHELAHVRRYDCLTQLVGQLACALHWFNPFAWVAARELRVERERACDDEVLRAGAKASDYADYLLRVARSTRIVGAAALGGLAMARPSQMAGRLLAVLDDRRRRGRVSLWTRAAGGDRCRRAVDGCRRRVTRLAVPQPTSAPAPAAVVQGISVTPAQRHEPTGALDLSHLDGGADSGRPRLLVRTCAGDWVRTKYRRRRLLWSPLAHRAMPTQAATTAHTRT